MNPDVQSAPTPRYTRLRELGRGASAVVELVYDDVRHTELAYKRWQRASAETRFRLKQQYRRALTVRHPNVVRLYELFAEGDETCLTMEAVLGVDVRTYVQTSHQPSNVAVVLDVLRQLTNALVTLHAAGIVHRDLKPSNVLVEADGRVVLLDGGFAWPRESQFDALDEHALTCTIPYLAPECLRGALPSVESDWYGLGALAAELIAGQPPFAGSLETMLRAKDDPATSLPTTYPDVPPELEALVCALLQRDPRARPSARIVQAALRELGRAQPLVARETAAETQSRVELATELQVEPPIDAASEPQIELAAEPQIETQIELAAEPQIEPQIEHAAESQIELATEPQIEPQIEHAAESQVETRIEHASELARLEQLLDAANITPLICVQGSAGIGKSRLLGEFLSRARQRVGWAVFDAQCESDSHLPYHALSAIMPQLITQLARVDPDRLRVLTQSSGFAALSRMFPAVEPLRGTACCTASEAQRGFIDGLLTFRQLWLELAKSARVLLLIDDFQFCDRDSGRLLQALISRPNPNLSLVLAYRADPVPSSVRQFLERADQPGPPASSLLDLNATKTSHATADSARAPSAAAPAANGCESTEPYPSDLGATLRAAEVATGALALELAADLYQSAIERSTEPPQALLREAALANTRAGRLDAAAKSWLTLAHSCPNRVEAQQLELEAGAAWLRAGNEQDGRALVCNVLRAAGVAWPRAPIITSTLERARALLQSARSAPDPSSHADGALSRFDALWTAAREVVLLEPTTGDALAARALREALRLGDPSRVLWTLGYEAVWEANLGGAYLRKHSRVLQARVAALAEQTGSHFDAAYARSVDGLVAWFGGEWGAAERALRDALRLYARVPEPTAHERHVLENFLIGTLEAQGKLSELHELLTELRIAAEQTGHVQAAAMCTLAELSLPALVRDQPLAAIARADAVLSRFANDDLTPLHFQHFVVTVSARLYAGHAAQAFQQVEQLWQRLGRTYFLRLDAVGVMLRQLRARAALALAKQSAHSEANRLCKLASKEAASIGDSGLLHARGLEHVIDCSVANLQGQESCARAHCAAAIDIFDRAGMALMRELARHASTVLAIDPAQADRDLRQSAAFFRGLDIQNPSALVTAWFPTLDM
jgi:tRNA A-37 threonylcarbamoyl transferase component Bud32